MNKRSLLLIALILTSFCSFAKGGLLDLVVTVEIRNTPVKNILLTIEQKTGVSFTYSPEVIDENRVVSISLQNKTIREGLTMIFGETIRFKEVGNHIVLLRYQPKEEIKERERIAKEYIFIGTITDAETGKPIKEASIYEIDERYATLSDQTGFYSLTVPATYELRCLYIKKKGYHENVVVLNGDSERSAMHNVALNPIKALPELSQISTVDSVSTQPELTFSDKAISGELVSPETQVHGENLEEIQELRWAQISLVPSVSIGSNLSTNALINNHFSFNVLGGFSKGVRGCEIGGIVNLDKEHVIGAQVGGIANLVGGNVIGGQVCGIANLVQGDFTGAQVGGIICTTKRDLHGVQVAGISGFIRGGFIGSQIAGIGNVVGGKSIGLQVGGVFNLSTDTLIGGQVSGISNFSRGGLNFFQVGGISNVAHKNYGLQIAGITNFSRENHGIQIGLINSSIEGNGVAIGLINFVKKGYHKTEISANEITPFNLSLKSGSQRLYNIYSVGFSVGTNPLYSAGFGFGSYFNLTSNEKLRLSVDLTGNIIFENQFTAPEFNQLYKASTTLDIRLAKWITFFAGPSFNVNVMAFANAEGQYFSTVPPYSMLTVQAPKSTISMWVGGQFGFRF